MDWSKNTTEIYEHFTIEKNVYSLCKAYTSKNEITSKLIICLWFSSLNILSEILLKFLRNHNQVWENEENNSNLYGRYLCVFYAEEVKIMPILLWTKRLVINLNWDHSFMLNKAFTQAPEKKPERKCTH